MANRNFNEFKMGLEKGRVELFADVAIGATGAPTIVGSTSKGIASVVRNSAGNYTITTTDPYIRLLGARAGITLAAGAPSTGSSVQMVVRSSTPVSKTLTVEFLGSAGTAVEITSGATVQFKLDFKNSTV